jgi:hypothetical protein
VKTFCGNLGWVRKELDSCIPVYVKKEKRARERKREAENKNKLTISSSKHKNQFAPNMKTKRDYGSHGTWNFQIIFLFIFFYKNIFFILFDQIKKINKNHLSTNWLLPTLVLPDYV